MNQNRHDMQRMIYRKPKIHHYGKVEETVRFSYAAYPVDAVVYLGYPILAE